MATKRSSAALISTAIVLTLSLTGCGPSKCEQAGGESKLSHYTPIIMSMPNGSGGFTATTQMTPVFKCRLPDGAILE